VKLTVFCFAALGMALGAHDASAQSYVPPSRPTATYRSPGYSSAAMAVTYTAPPATPAAAGAMHVAAVPSYHQVAPRAVAPMPPQFRPINPAPKVAQRQTMASRSPTPASPQVSGTAAKAASHQPLPPYQPSMNGQGWIAPTPSMASPYGASAYGNSGGYPAAGGYAGQGAYHGDAAYASGQPMGIEGYPGPQYGGAPTDDAGMYGSEGECGGSESGHGCGHCCAFLHGCCRSCGLHAPGDMVQHMPFFGTTHGYYYFRPYHVMHVFSQQELATRWGGDARNPYDNCMFQRIYEQMGVEARPTNGWATTGAPAAGYDYAAPTPVPEFGNEAPTYGVPGGAAPSNGSILPGGMIPLPNIETIPAPAQ